IECGGLLPEAGHYFACRGHARQINTATWCTEICGLRGEAPCTDNLNVPTHHRQGLAYTHLEGALVYANPRWLLAQKPKRHGWRNAQHTGVGQAGRKARSVS